MYAQSHSFAQDFSKSFSLLIARVSMCLLKVTVKMPQSAVTLLSEIRVWNGYKSVPQGTKKTLIQSKDKYLTLWYLPVPFS